MRSYVPVCSYAHSYAYPYNYALSNGYSQNFYPKITFCRKTQQTTCKNFNPQKL